MKNLNLAYNAQHAFSSFITMLLWTSWSEILLVLGVFITFCAAPMHMGLMWLYIAHIPRGVFGTMIAFKLPRSHTVIDSIALTNKDTQSMECLKKALAFNISVHLL